MAFIIEFELPGQREASKFTVYPFAEEDSHMLLRSKHNCIIVDFSAKKMRVSPRFNYDPVFQACAGVAPVDVPDDLQVQIDYVLARPTGRVVELVG